MTRSNYQEMRTNGTTEVFFPLFKDTWELPLYATFNTMLATDIPMCWVKGPHKSADWAKLNYTETIRQAYIFKHSVSAVARNSGEYVIKCSGRNWNEPNQTSQTVDITKSLKVTFIQGTGVISFPQHMDKIMMVFYSTTQAQR